MSKRPKPVRGSLKGRVVSPAKGPMKRLWQRLTYGSLASAVGLGALTFGFNLFSAQDQVCGVSFLQPQLSDVCGALGLGHRPTKIERSAWEGREPGSCLALRSHIERFPQGAYRQEAAEMLTARRVTPAEIWTPATRRLSLFVGQEGAPSANGAAARSAAIARAIAPAERLCKGLAATMFFRFTSATPAPQIWNCERTSRGLVCGFEGEAVCTVEERRVQETETCGR